MSDVVIPPPAKRKNLSDEDIKVTIEALARHNQNIDAAAKDLGLTRKQLYNRLRSKHFKGIWGPERGGTKIPLTIPGEATEIHRPPMQLNGAPPATILTPEAVEEMIQKEDALVRAGLDKIGLSSDSAELASSLQKFHRRHFRSVIDLMGGGMAKQFVELMAEAEKVQKQIEDKANIDSLKTLCSYRLGILEQMNQMYDRAVKASLIGAKVAQLQNSNDPDRKKKQRPGFQELRSAAPDGPPSE